ncbi:hypothetical protein SAMN05444166_2569 [Singulisphaera sp. GP187]|nr:hypothetical protein [Singulisphaera sp. GP187]SIO12243.1 hypothetical protein SAMN05444166_2569 [Singulisphaera sp. GP187]
MTYDEAMKLVDRDRDWLIRRAGWDRMMAVSLIEKDFNDEDAEG